MPRHKALDPNVRIFAMVSPANAARLDLLTYDAERKRNAFGIRSKVVDDALTEYFKDRTISADVETRK